MPYIMAPILIGPLGEQAYELLRQLEALHILRVVPAAEAPAPARHSVADLIGSLSPETGEQMLAETTTLRNEWERVF